MGCRVGQSRFLEQVRSEVEILSTLPKKAGTLILRLDFPQEGHSDYDKIQSSLSGLDGVLNTEINYLTHTIKIEFDPQKLTIEEIQKELRDVRARSGRETRKIT